MPIFTPVSEGTPKRPGIRGLHYRFSPTFQRIKPCTTDTPLCSKLGAKLRRGLGEPRDFRGHLDSRGSRDERIDGAAGIVDRQDFGRERAGVVESVDAQETLVEVGELSDRVLAHEDGRGNGAGSVE